MLIEHLQKIHKKQQQKVTDFYTAEGLHVYFKDQMLNDEIDVEKVVSRVESIVPQHLRGEIEMVIIGHFDEFEENHFNAFYKDGMIHVTNNQQDNEDMIEDIVHEIAHSTEEPYGYQLYGDNKIKDEFLRKRHKAYCPIT